MASDCINASLVETSALKSNSSLAQLLSAYQNGRRLVGNHQVPVENELTIYNRSKLLVNLEVYKKLYYEQITFLKYKNAAKPTRDSINHETLCPVLRQFLKR